MNRQSSLRQLNYSHVLLIVGIALSLLVVMFRPAGAEATLPTSVEVFLNSDASGTPATVKVGGLSESVNNVDYNVILHGDKTPTKVALTGVPLVDFLEEAGVKTDGVQFVKIRVGGVKDDSKISLIPLNPTDTERPPILLSKGERPKLGPFATPAIVPGQPKLTDKLYQDSFYSFSKKDPPLRIVPGAPGAKIIGVRIDETKRSNGEYTLKVVVTSGEKNATRTIQWYGFNSKGEPQDLGSGESIETKNATSGSSTHQINVVVIEPKSGSTGTTSYGYTSKKKTKGKTNNPFPDPTPATGGNGGSGGGSGSGTPGGTTPGGATNNIPKQTVSPPANQTQPVTPTPPTTQPTDSTSSSTSTIDTTAITNAAQNVSGNGGLTTVSGVLLSAPTVAPAAAAGGSPISALPAPIADQLNSIFQPVNEADDAWAYLLTLLFAFTFSGAVREWVKP